MNKLVRRTTFDGMLALEIVPGTPTKRIAIAMFGLMNQLSKNKAYQEFQAALSSGQLSDDTAMDEGFCILSDYGRRFGKFFGFVRHQANGNELLGFLPHGTEQGSVASDDLPDPTEEARR